MNARAFVICFPFTIFITVLATRTLHPIIYIPMACLIGIGSYFIYPYCLQLFIFPHWERLAQHLDKTVEFRLGLVGQLFYVVLICLLISIMVLVFRTKFQIILQYTIFALESIALFSFSKILLELAWWSPLYKGPALVSTPTGIQNNSCFIPWADVENVSGRSAEILVKTRSGCSEYEQSIETSLNEPHEVKFTVYGALPESIAHYLSVRAKLQNQLNSVQK